MFRWLWRLLYGSTAVEFRCAYPLSESIERLRAATERSVFSSLSKMTAVGKVTDNVVRLQRVIPMVGNSFKPFFLGRFEERGGSVVLAGRFTMLPLVKAFMTFWFGMVILFSLAMLLGSLHSQGANPGMFALQPFVMLGGGIALTALGKWLARNDQAWLSQVIERALGVPESGAGDLGAVSGTVAEIDAAAVPIQLKVSALFVASSGALALVSRFTLSRLPPNTGPGEAGTDLLTQMGDWIFAYGALVIALAAGIWLRRPWAWWGGFALLGLSVAWPVFAAQGKAFSHMPAGLAIVFGALSCVVTAVWGRWWYGQRRHFLWG